MLIREFYKTRSDGVNLYRNYSDANRYIIQNETGISYIEAIDIEDAPYTYLEGERIETNEFEDEDASKDSVMSETEEKAMAYDILTGVTE